MQNREFSTLVNESLGFRQKFLGPAARLLQKSDTDRITYMGDMQRMVRDIQTASFDDLVSVKNLEVVRDGQFGISLNTNKNNLKFSTLSLQQLCTQVDIPSSYIKRCLEYGEPDLAVQNLNHWISRMEPDKSLFLRATKEPGINGFGATDRLHGVLSSRYVTFDDTEVVAMTDDILGDQGGYRIQNFHVSPDQMRMRLISDHNLDLFSDDDDRKGGLSLGLDIANSRVGTASFSVRVILYRSACDNGMIFGASDAQFFKRRHSGTISVEIRETFREVLGQLPSFMDHCRNHVESSMMRKISNEDLANLLNRFRVEAVNSLSTATEITEKVEQQYEMTTWGFINAITEVAQQYQLEQRDRMERFAGTLLMKR